eukprot:TRINITY_DN2343_c0_g1_i1.p1 TRINITY_DN2343_c0_g1~~TRINITY_DN2343_c0_g1_i1.p1  ORF type:complete len:372 (-),score=40.38 TRINITY_DN2343_c0_g1_i1:107-1222(-)
MSSSSSTQDRFQEYKSRADYVKNEVKATTAGIKADVKGAIHTPTKFVKTTHVLSPPQPKYHSTPSNKVRPLKRLVYLSWNRVLMEDYCHNKLLTAKSKFYYDKPHPFTINAKTVINKRTNDKVSDFYHEKRNTWLKLITSFDQYQVETRFWSDRRVRLFLDTPFVDAKNTYKPFLTFRSDIDASGWKVSGGVNYIGDRCKAMSRVSTDDRQNVFLEEKSTIRDGKYLFASFLTFDLRGLRLPRYDFTLGYEDRDFDFYLQHDSENPDVITLGALTFSGVYRYRDFTLCGQARRDKFRQDFVLGVHWKINKDLQLRAKINNRLDFSLAQRYRLHNNISLVLGTQLNFGAGAKIADFSRFLPFPIGLTLDLSA